jgi:hypothetical protein
VIQQATVGVQATQLAPALKAFFPDGVFTTARTVAQGRPPVVDAPEHLRTGRGAGQKWFIVLAPQADAGTCLTAAVQFTHH